MKLHTDMRPNPRLVRMFAAETGLEIPMAPLDLLAGENRREPYLSENPADQIPCLELDGA